MAADLASLGYREDPRDRYSPTAGQGGRRILPPTRRAVRLPAGPLYGARSPASDRPSIYGLEAPRYRLLFPARPKRGLRSGKPPLASLYPRPARPSDLANRIYIYCYIPTRSLIE